MPSTRSRRGSGDQPAPRSAELARADAEIASCTSVGLPASARVLFAVVDANGTLVRGLGVTSVTRLAAGMYQVAFDQDITAAGYLGTVGIAAGSGLAPQGAITVAPRSGIPNAVFVETYGGGAHLDRPFHLAVLT